MRAKGEYLKVFGAWGWVEGNNISITMYRSMDTLSYIEDKDYPKIPPRPTISEDGTDIVIGKSSPKPSTSLIVTPK